MSESEARSMHLSIPDSELKQFARDRARLFFGGNASQYIGALIRLDRERNIVPDEIARRLAASVDDRELAAAS